jgi:hypothetical protein
MTVQKCVLVYGRSLNLAGITASLKLDANLDVRWVDPHQCTAREVLAEYIPETIIYDLTDPPTDLDLVLLGDRPGTLLIGVDPSSNEVLMVTGQRSRVVTAGALAALVTEHGRRSPTGDRFVSEEEESAI